MMISDFASLTDMARQAPMNNEFAARMRERGTQILDQAIDVFFRPDREVTDARAAVNDLLDLQTAVRVCVERAEGEARDHYQSAADSEGYYSAQVPRSSHMSGPRKFVEDLHRVLPLYAAVAMVPGPMSLSVKNFAREFYSREASSSSYSESRSERDSAGGSLLLLGGGASSSGSRAQSSSWEKTREYFEKMTTDERVLPVMQDLRDRLEQADTRPPNEMRVGDQSMPYEPERLYLPESGTSDYAARRY